MLLADWRYEVRRKLAGLFPSVLSLWTAKGDQEAIFQYAVVMAAEHKQWKGGEAREAQGGLTSASWGRLAWLLLDDPPVDPPAGKGRAEEDETAVLLLGELAARSPALEARAAHALCRVATHAQELLAAATAVLDDVAQQLGYASRQALLAALAPSLANRWIASRRGVAELLGDAPGRALWQEELGSVARAVAASAEAARNTNMLFLEYAEYALAPLLQSKSKEAVQLFGRTVAAASVGIKGNKARGASRVPLSLHPSHPT